MDQPMVLFSEVASRYKALFFDASGVLKTAERLYDGVPGLLADLRERRVNAYLLSNDASKCVPKIAGKYADPHHGVLIPEHRVVTSGLVASHYLKKHHVGQRVAWLGPEACTPYITDAGCIPVCFADTKSHDDFDVFALMDNGGFDWRREVNRAVNFLRARPEVPLLAPNPDLVYPVPEGGVNVASGALARMLEAVLDRPFRFFGKPAREMFVFALDLARQEIPGLKPEECIVFEDAESGVEAALAAGMVCIGVGPTERLGAANRCVTDYSTLEPCQLV
jgi:ribonucleotide monophosphatase NagD (HAD superfamily)